MKRPTLALFKRPLSPFGLAALAALIPGAALPLLMLPHVEFSLLLLSPAAILSWLCFVGADETEQNIYKDGALTGFVTGLALASSIIVLTSTFFGPEVIGIKAAIMVMLKVIAALGAVGILVYTAFQNRNTLADALFTEDLFTQESPEGTTPTPAPTEPEALKPEAEQPSAAKAEAAPPAEAPAAPADQVIDATAILKGGKASAKPPKPETPAEGTQQGAA